MSVRRLAPSNVQPQSFEFNAENRAWVKKQITKYPKGREASAVIPLLMRAQEQEGGWVTEAAILAIANRLGMAKIRVLEVATFYTQFNLSPVGKYFIQLCGTTPCMLRGSEDLKEVCRDEIGEAGDVSEDGLFSWSEVECLGACVNAPMCLINSDPFEDLTPDNFKKLIANLRAGEEVKPGPQNGRQHSAPLSGMTSLTNLKDRPSATKTRKTVKTDSKKGDIIMTELDPKLKAKMISTPFGGAGDDLTRINGVGEGLEKTLNGLGVYHFYQVAEWDDEDLELLEPHLKFKGRAERDDWIGQAKKLAKTSHAKPTYQINEDGEKVLIDPKLAAQMLSGPDGEPDDLSVISGVGEKLQGVLNKLGVYHYYQIAAWDKKDLELLEPHLKFKGRAERDDWIGQAKKLAKDSPAGKSAKIDPALKAKLLAGPKGKADDLTRILGVGKGLEETLNKLGIFHFWQLADWTEKEIAMLEPHLKFKGRSTRDRWIDQAKALEKGASEDDLRKLLGQ